ncbi:MAG: Ig-like domain-containing protein [Myxococcaceae bacterium]
MLPALALSALFVAACYSPSPTPDDGTQVTVSITPASASVEAGKTLQFSASVTGSANTEVRWSVEESNGGTISATGLYTSAAEGVFHVVATSKADAAVSATSTVTVTPAQDGTISVSISPAVIVLDQGADKVFSASISGTPNREVNWSVTGGAANGTIDEQGKYIAPNKAGTFEIKATSVADPSRSATASISVREVSLSIVPANTTLSPGASATFTANVTGTTNTAVTWDVVGGTANGTLTPGQNQVEYTAPSRTGTYALRATSVADPTRQATATITVSTQQEIVVSITTRPTSLATNASYSFIASAQNSTQGVTWTATHGMILQDGQYVAPSTANNAVTVTATSKEDPSKRDSVTFTVTAQPAQVSISPSSTTLYPGGEREFSASVQNTSNPAVTYQIVDASGNPNPNGGTLTVNPQDARIATYVAPTTPGTYYVRVRSSAEPTATATATVTVVDGSFTLTGTISYAGPHTGRIYVLATDTNNAPIAGTSLASPGNFTIRGVSFEDEIRVLAFMDRVGIANYDEGTSPSSSLDSSFRSSVGGNFTANVVLLNPTTVTPTSPSPGITPGVDSAFLDWTHQPGATAYRVYWSQTGNPGPANNTGSRVVPILAYVLVDGLSAGNWYFSVAPIVDGTELTPGPAVMANVGAGPGTNRITGTVSMSGFTPAPSLTLLALSSSGMNDRVMHMNASGASQQYTFTGLVDDTYTVVAFADIGGDRTLRVTDPSDSAEARVVLSSSNGTADLGLRAGASVSTFREVFNGESSFQLRFMMKAGGPLPVKVEVNGPGMSQAQDLPISFGNAGYHVGSWDRFTNVPSVGTAYNFIVTYSDGSISTVTSSVNVVLTPSTPLSPVGPIGQTTPTFSWSAPSPAPAASYSYGMHVLDAAGNVLWTVDGIPSSITSVPYNFDGQASPATLSFGQTYWWVIDAFDELGNGSRIWQPFIVQ